MKAEQAKKLADDALANLAHALEHGPSDAMKNCLATMARFHRYSFTNAMLIAMQRPDATRVAGFQTWKSLGRFVKKGEKGIVIIAPMTIRARSEDGAEESPGNEGRTIVRFKAVHVFDVVQTDGTPLPEAASIAGNPAGLTEILKRFVEAQGIGLEYSATLGGADGLSSGGKITLRQALSPANEFHVLVHELAHEMLHKKDGKDRPSKTVRETEAEAVAFVVSQAIGLDTNSAAADYIQLYRGDTETLAASLGRIQKTASTILQAITDEQGTPSAFSARAVPNLAA